MDGWSRRARDKGSVGHTLSWAGDGQAAHFSLRTGVQPCGYRFIAPSIEVAFGKFGDKDSVVIVQCFKKILINFAGIFTAADKTYGFQTLIADAFIAVEV